MSNLGNIARGTMGIALAGALVAGGAAVATQPAQAKTVKAQDWYTYVWNNKHAQSSSHQVKIVKGKLKLVHKAIRNGNGARFDGTEKCKSSYKIAGNCKYYKDFKQKLKKGKLIGDPDSTVVQYSKPTSQKTTLARLKKANAKRSDSSQGKSWIVAFQVKNGKVVKIGTRTQKSADGDALLG